MMDVFDHGGPHASGPIRSTTTGDGWTERESYEQSGVDHGGWCATIVCMRVRGGDNLHVVLLPPIYPFLSASAVQASSIPR